MPCKKDTTLHFVQVICQCFSLRNDEVRDQYVLYIYVSLLTDISENKFTSTFGFTRSTSMVFHMVLHSFRWHLSSLALGNGLY